MVGLRQKRRQMLPNELVAELCDHVPVADRQLDKRPTASAAILLTSFVIRAYLLERFRQKFVCRWLECDQAFGTEVDFVEHVYTHVLHAPAFVCRWSDCSQTLSIGARYLFAKHVSSHIQHQNQQEQSQWGPYQCRQCPEKRFTNASEWLAHERLVHQYVFACPACTTWCAARKELDLHVALEHPNYVAAMKPYGPYLGAQPVSVRLAGSGAEK